MERIECVTEALIEAVKQCLYNDELAHCLTLDYFENRIQDLGEVYISRNKGLIDALVHIRYDGNSHFTTFYAQDESGLREVADLVKNMPYPDLLLAGPASEVSIIKGHMGLDRVVDGNLFYVFDKKPKGLQVPMDMVYKVATDKDFETVKAFKWDFFQVETDEEKACVADKIVIDSHRLLVYNNKPVGYGSFFGSSRSYIDISNVYVAGPYRGKGYGRYLLTFMIEEAFTMGKVPVLQVSKRNQAAIKTYEGVGFKKAFDYAFEFIHRRNG